MLKRIALITLRVHVRVPDGYSDEEVAAIRSRLAHYDIRGGLREVVQHAVYPSKTERSMVEMERDVDIDILRQDRAAELCEDHPNPKWEGTRF